MIDKYMQNACIYNNPSLPLHVNDKPKSFKIRISGKLPCSAVVKAK